MHEWVVLPLKSKVVYFEIYLTMFLKLLDDDRVYTL